MTFQKGQRPPQKGGKVAKTEPVEAQSDNVINMNMTPEERAIYSRVASGDDDWQTITEESAEDFSLSEDPFKLPLPAQRLRDQKKFAFRWITRSSARLDQIKSFSVPRRWWPVNSTQPAPGLLDAFIDRSTGCVQREDQMLVFKPWWMYEREHDLKIMLADGNTGDITKKDRQQAGDVEFRAGKRVADKGSLREEVKGDDVHFTGEAEVDQASGINTPEAADSDLVVNE
jgi:hypothetical protein